MGESDWDTFFDLVEKIRRMKGTAADRSAEVRQQAQEHDAGDDLDGFLADMTEE